MKQDEYALAISDNGAVRKCIIHTSAVFAAFLIKPVPKNSLAGGVPAKIIGEGIEWK